ncbi:MAG: D-2-hydroxyacid dehydrogenase [Epsilonproteobacteria bacterium]|nr:MAG: D-2-hydroxyacid dehydrogenase [Campylobacterota bacterium]
MQIVFLDRKTLGDDITLKQFDKIGNIVSFDSTNPNETLSRVKDADVVVTNKVVIDKTIMDNSNIKLICIAATGMNNIDLPYAKQKGIEVKNVVGYSTSSVAQLTLSYALQFVQKINFYDNYVKSGEWQKSKIFTNNDKPFYELDGKIWGIIGLGNIGKKVANIAQSFGCKVIYYSTSGKNSDRTYPCVSLKELLSTSDIVSLHCPLNEQTNNLLNSTNLKDMKDGAILLNLGRGGLVNEQDIANIINNGQNIYFATDVVTAEPIAEDSPLLTIEDKSKIIITPHIAWASKEARCRLLNGIERNIIENT